ncbi:CATRA system-associated protein [Kitasatospora purpeofusca]|uniref:CATRA system-associated protein n=1 Tax=Kitasatospora purpeofusca TaxID=67352 RepID=UPI0036B31602
MRNELNGDRAEALEILADVTRVDLAPGRWHEVEAALAALAEALDRGDRAAFRRELHHIEDLVPVERTPRALTGTTGPTEPVLERTAVLVERLGPPDGPARGTAGHNTPANEAGESCGHER